MLGMSRLHDAHRALESLSALDCELSSGIMPFPGRDCPLSAHGGRPQGTGPLCPSKPSFKKTALSQPDPRGTLGRERLGGSRLFFDPA